MPPKDRIYPLSAVRALALHAQGLAHPAQPDTPPSRDDIYDTVLKIGCVQIDTLQMVSRSQYLTLWSRLDSYDTNDFDDLMFGDGDRRLFEYWMHAACIIPLSEYRYCTPLMKRHRDGQAGWRRAWIERPGNRELVERTLEHVRRNGPARASDFEHRRERSNGWWDWKPAKLALEHLYNMGDLMVSERVNFQRVYDLKEKVLPNSTDAMEPTFDETCLYRLERSMRALGICQPAQVGDYTHMKRTEAKPYVERLVEDGTFLKVKGRLHDGSVHELVVHRNDVALLKKLENLEKASDGELVPQRTTFLSPFDNLFWAKDRDMRFWGFRQILEAYKPEPQRIWGYYCMPILHGDRLVGRFDPKLERREGILRLRSLYLEPGVSPGEGLVSDVANAMRDFMAFHDARELIIQRSDPVDFGPRLLKAM